MTDDADSENADAQEGHRIPIDGESTDEDSGKKDATETAAEKKSGETDTEMGGTATGDGQEHKESTRENTPDSPGDVTGDPSESTLEDDSTNERSEKSLPDRFQEFQREIRESLSEGLDSEKIETIVSKLDEIEEATRELRSDVAETTEDVSTLSERADEIETEQNDLRRTVEDHIRRSEHEREQIRDYAVEDFAAEMIRVKQSLRTAIEIEELPESAEQRLQLVNKEFEQTLAAADVTPIDDENAAFDPVRHQVIEKRDSADHETEEIIEITEPGYAISDRVLKPARVVVAV